MSARLLKSVKDSTAWEIDAHQSICDSFGKNPSANDIVTQDGRHLQAVNWLCNVRSCLRASLNVVPRCGERGEGEKRARITSGTLLCLGGLGLHCLVLPVLRADFIQSFCSYLQSKLRVLNNEKRG